MRGWHKLVNAQKILKAGRHYWIYREGWKEDPSIVNMDDIESILDLHRDSLEGMYINMIDEPRPPKVL